MGATTFRFAIGTTFPLSEIWTVTATKNDVYLTAATQKGKIKVSLHGSGVCQYALLEDFLEEIGRTNIDRPADRTILRWKRDPTPKEGAQGAFRLIFAADGAWPAVRDLPDKKVPVLIPPPPAGHAVEVIFVYSLEDPADHLQEVDPGDKLVAKLHLQDGPYVTVFASVQEHGPDFFSPMAIPATFGILTDGFDLSPSEPVIDGLVMHFIVQQHEGMATLYSLHNMTLTGVVGDPAAEDAGS